MIEYILKTGDVAKMGDRHLADELGQVQAVIGAWKEREAQLKGELIDRGHDVEGSEFAITLSDVNRKQTNWRLIAEKLGATRQLITAHTRRQVYTAVRVYELED